MTNITSVGSVVAGRSVEARPVRPGTEHARPEASLRRASDKVELSAAAKTYIEKLRAMPEVRQDLIDSTRSQIAAGSYESDEKLDAAVDELLKDLFA